MQTPVHVSRALPPFILSLLILLCNITTSAQHIGGAFTKSDTTPLFRRAGAPLNKDSVIEEKLVQLALTGPTYTTTDNQIKISEYNLSKARRAWLNLLTLSANYNDQTFAKPQTTGANGPAYVYPKYFFGLTIPIGLFFSMGPDIKSAKQTVEVRKKDQEGKARDLRADVLTKYKQYKNFGQLIALQNTIVVDDQTFLAQAEKKFKDGSIGLEQYNQANRVYNTDLSTKLNLQLSQDMMKLEIEKLIGVNLESVIK